MHEEINELLAGYALGDLSELESSQVKEHLYECEQCRGELERLEGLLECTQHMRELSADAHLCQSAKESLFATVKSEEMKTHPDRPKTGLVLIWRAVMNNKIMAFATAGVIIICVLLGINLINKPTTSGVAWGSLVDRIDKISSYRSQMRISTTYAPGHVVKQTLDLYHSSKYGNFIDRNWNEIGLNIKIYSSFSDNTTTVVYPRVKKYARIVLDEEQVNMMRDFDDPMYPVREIMSFNYRELGSKVIDGKKVEGIEINDSRFGKGNVGSCVGRLWVDVETNLPVLYEARATAGSGKIPIELVQDSFEWDIGHDESIFEPNLSEYNLTTEVVSQPANEETTVQMLRSFSEMAGGEYPHSLALFSCRTQLNKIYRENKIEEIGLKRAILFWEEDDFEWEPFIRINMQLTRTCQFYGNMVKEDKDVAYYGKTVTAKDMNAPLMRWRISDDLYRVLFGDLSIKDVSIEQLAELEADLKNLQFLKFPTPK